MSPPRKAYEFIELRGFQDDWALLGYSDDDLYQLEDRIAADPRAHPVITGTGGLRKMRFAGAKAGIGKRGGARVCFAVYPDSNIILLVMAYTKKQKDNLPNQEKKALRKLLDQCGKCFAANRYA